jgi:hypothetical protein
MDPSLKRRKEPGERLRRVIIKVTEEQFNILQERSAKAGLYMSAYIRQMTFKGKLTPRLTEEEKDLFRQLVGLSNTLHQIKVNIPQQGFESVASVLEAECVRIDEWLKKWKP